MELCIGGIKYDIVHQGKIQSAIITPSISISTPGLKLLSLDNHILTDKNGLYLLVKEEI